MKVIGVMLLTFLLIGCDRQEHLWEKNAALLTHQIFQWEEESGIDELIPFEWDEAYSFAPYLQKEFIYEIVGYQWSDIHETYDEAMIQVVFMKNQQVVCHLYGYPEEIGFDVDFGSFDHQTFIHIKNNEKYDLHVDIRNDQLILHCNE